MASELHVDAIKHSGGTSAITINSSGHVHSAGMIVQMQSTTTYSNISTSSSSLTASGLIVSITPKFANSNILIMLRGGNINWGSAEHDHDVTLYRQLTGGSYSSLSKLSDIHSDSTYGVNHCSEVLDTSHNTTNQINYQTYFSATAGTAYHNFESCPLTLRAMEITQ